MRDEDDNMEAWDEEKLQQVIGKKHGEADSGNTTEIVSHFWVSSSSSSSTLFAIGKIFYKGIVLGSKIDQY